MASAPGRPASDNGRLCHGGGAHEGATVAGACSCCLRSTEVTDKIERIVNTISGIEELISISAEGVSQVVVRFRLEKDVDVAAQEVRDKVNQIVPELPKDVDPPVVES